MNTKIAAAVGSLIVVLVGINATLSSSDYVSDGTLVKQDNALLIQDQKPGADIIVSYAKLSEPGYVVLYTTTTTTQTVVGTSDLLSAGEHRNVHVHHKSGTKVASGTDVSAAIVADDGDGSYSPDTDTDVLVPATDDGATAEISDDATLDTTVTDEELGDLLEDAGYDTADVPEDATTTEAADTDEATTTPDMTAPDTDTSDASLDQATDASTTDDMATTTEDGSTDDAAQ